MMLPVQPTLHPITVALSFLPSSFANALHHFVRMSPRPALFAVSYVSCVRPLLYSTQLNFPTPTPRLFIVRLFVVRLFIVRLFRDSRRPPLDLTCLKLMRPRPAPHGPKACQDLSCCLASLSSFTSPRSSTAFHSLPFLPPLAPHLGQVFRRGPGRLCNGLPLLQRDELPCLSGDVHRHTHRAKTLYLLINKTAPLKSCSTRITQEYSHK